MAAQLVASVPPRPAPHILKAEVGEMEKKEEERMGAVR
jgi:hypothetical protein